MTWIMWLLALYGFYKFVKWVRRKNFQRAYSNWFLQELGREVRANPEQFKKLFPGMILPRE